MEEAREKLTDILAIYEKMKKRKRKKYNSMKWLLEKKSLVANIVDELKAKKEELDFEALAKTLNVIAYQEGVRQKNEVILKNGRKKRVYSGIQVRAPMVEKFLKSQGLI